MLIDFRDWPTLDVIPPTFTVKDAEALTAMGISLDLSLDLRAQS